MNARYLRYILLPLAMFAAGVAAYSPAQLGAQENVSTDSYFGIVDGHWRPQAADELGVSWNRITFDWARIQPDGPGDFNTEAVRPEWLHYDAQHQRQVVGLIINTPAWASASGTPTAVPDGLYLPVDSPENHWAVFLRQLVETYAPQGIHHWIIWNWPDTPQTFEGSIEDYYRLVKIAHSVIKPLDEEAEIFLGGLVWWYDIATERERWLARFLAIALADPTATDNNNYFDGVTLSILIRPTPFGGLNSTTDSVGDITRTIRQQLNDAGLADKHIWITELNASPTLDLMGGLPNATSGISLEQQADFVVQGMATALAAGAERVAVFRLFDADFSPGETPPYGLLRHDNTRRPAFDGYASVIQTFSGTISATAGRSTNSRLVVLNQADRTVFVMWSAGTQPVDYWVEARFDDTFTLTDPLGNTLPEPRFSVGPGDATVLVIETPPAIPDRSGAVLVSGSPRIFILNTTEDRDVWASLGDATGVQVH